MFASGGGGMPKITIKITGLHENLGRDDGIEETGLLGTLHFRDISNRKCIAKHIPKISAQYKRLNTLFFLSAKKPFHI